MEYIPQSVLVDNSVYKIDVFYDERTLPESETTADWVVKQLERNGKLAVRKKLLSASRSERFAAYNIQANTVRHENTEKPFADSLIRALNAKEFIKDGNKEFRPEAVRGGYKTPNYISIFVRG